MLTERVLWSLYRRWWFAEMIAPLRRLVYTHSCSFSRFVEHISITGKNFLHSGDTKNGEEVILRRFLQLVHVHLRPTLVLHDNNRKWSTGGAQVTRAIALLFIIDWKTYAWSG